MYLKYPADRTNHVTHIVYKSMYILYLMQCRTYCGNSWDLDRLSPNALRIGVLNGIFLLCPAITTTVFTINHA